MSVISKNSLYQGSLYQGSIPYILLLLWLGRKILFVISRTSLNRGSTVMGFCCLPCSTNLIHHCWASCIDLPFILWDWILLSPLVPGQQRMAQLWERSPPTNVVWVRLWPSVLCGLSLRVCYWLLPEAFTPCSLILFSSLIKNQHLQIPIRPR